jgi:predicted aspartyl protease
MPGTSEFEILGHINERRPLVRLFFLKPAEDHIVLVDTGCTWEMVMRRSWVERLNLVATGITECATVATGESAIFDIYRKSILWFGSERMISIHVPAQSNLANVSKSARTAARDDDHVAEIGIGLLQGTSLGINFLSNEIVIRRLHY